MANVNRFSEGLIDIAERFADVVDSAQGKGGRKSRQNARWLLLPAAGATAYALATSTSTVARKTRGLMRLAKNRATDLPDADLLGRVKEVAGVEQSRSSSGARSRTSSRSRSRSTRRRTGSQQRRRTSTAS